MKGIEILYLPTLESGWTLLIEVGSLKYVVGCQCPPGTVLDEKNKKCVKPEQCDLCYPIIYHLDAQAI